MKILLTGAAGVLGKLAMTHFIRAGIQVRAFDQVEAGDTDVEWVCGDVADYADVVRAARGCDSIVHLAGLLMESCLRQPNLAIRVNIEGTLNVFRAAVELGINKILYASSICAYGYKHAESSMPLSIYGMSKVAMENMAWIYWNQHSISSAGMRIGIVYGPGRERGVSAAITLACKNAARMRPFIIPFSGNLNVIYIGDVGRAIAELAVNLQNGAAVVDVSGIETTVSDVINAIKKFNPRSEVSFYGDELSFSVDLGTAGILRPKQYAAISLEEGLRRTCEYYRTESGDI